MAHEKTSLLGDITPAAVPARLLAEEAAADPPGHPRHAAAAPRDALVALAAEDDVESRLVTESDGSGTCSTARIAALPARSQPDWTLLVQGVNLHDAEADALLRRSASSPTRGWTT